MDVIGPDENDRVEIGFALSKRRGREIGVFHEIQHDPAAEFGGALLDPGDDPSAVTLVERVAFRVDHQIVPASARGGAADEAAGPVAHLEQAARFEFLEGAPDGAFGQAELFAELALGGEFLPRRKSAGGDHGFEISGEFRIKFGGRHDVLSE